MIDRLRNSMTAPDPVLACAARLVASAPRVDDSEAAKCRVRQALEHHPKRTVWWPALMRPVVVVSVLVAGAAVAAAAVGHGAIAEAIQRLVGGSDGVAQRGARDGGHGRTQRATQPTPARASVVTETAPQVEPPPAAQPASTALASASVASPSAPHRARRGGRHQEPVASPARTAEPSRGRPVAPDEPTAPSQSPAPTAAPTPVAQAAAVEETKTVAAAARALRVENDPVRAGALLDGYLRQFPSGVLAEEALALAVQAATARGDGRARELARSYLDRYPQGRFARYARQAADAP